MNNVNVVNLETDFVPRNTDAEELTVDNLVVQCESIDHWIELGVRYVELAVKGNAVRYSLDGNDPASSGAGAILGTGIYVWRSEKVKAAKFVESTAGSDGVIRFQAGR
jgi:hypothetical protein